jgi:alpha-amylase
MFGWPYEDIKQECAFLAQAGYMGVKVFPPQETLFSYEWPQDGEINPWYFIYQPVSYKLNGRSGTREQLRDMIQTCRAAGVRVYADAVINHMTGGGNDVFDSHRNGNGGYCAYWGAKASTGDSPFFTQDFMYVKSNNTGEEPGMEYPAAAYIATDFHCERSLNSWTDPFILNNGWLVGLADLDTESDYVRDRIAAYMTDLLGIGFSGFRVDAAKHIYPESLSQIFKVFKDNMGGGDLPDDFIAYLEVIMGGEMQMLMCNDGEYNFGRSFEDKMRNAGLSDSDIYKIKIWESAYPKEFPECGSWQIASERFVAENDCHDDQNPGSSSRDMGDKGSVLIKDKNVDLHRQFETQLFSRTDGNWQIKTLLSSYSFMDNGAAGFPDGHSDCDKCVGENCGGCTKSMKYSPAYDPNSCGYDCVKDGQWQEGVYTRVHRDQAIINSMRQWMGLSVEEDPTKLGLPPTCGNQQFTPLQ